MLILLQISHTNIFYVNTLSLYADTLTFSFSVIVKAQRLSTSSLSLNDSYLFLIKTRLKLDNWQILVDRLNQLFKHIID